MIEIYPRLFVGDEMDCRQGTAEMAIVHACKHPCHQRAVGYSGNLPSTHPNYLVLEQKYDLYLNMIDPDKPLFMPPLFTCFLDFAKRHWEEGRSILIHCNRGESRSPTLAMMFIAKVIEKIPNDSFASAFEAFAPFYPLYQPGLGIRTYLADNWAEF